jgi:predicted DNA-binding transcriptional regulator YafY
VRGDQIIRQWQLVRLLSSAKRGKSIPDLKQELRVTSRTVRRDLQALEHAGFPLISETKGGDVLWRFIDGYQPEAPVALTTDELMALYLSRRLLEPLHGTPMQEGIQSALQKIGAIVCLQTPSAAHGPLNASISVSHFGQKDYRKSRDVVEKLLHAIRNHFTLDFSYRSPRREQSARYRLDPYKLWYQDHGLYVVGWDLARGEYRVFAAERIRTMKLTNQRFEMRNDFNFNQMKQTAFRFVWGEPKQVRIRFEANEAPFAIERTWHPSQKVCKEESGSVVLEFKVADLKEVKRWLIGWGAGAEVLEPVELAEDVVKECRSVVSRRDSRAKGSPAI